MSNTDGYESPRDGAAEGRRLGGALKWAFAMKWGQQITGSAVRLVLMALLDVEAFGLVGMAWLYIMFVEMFLDQGFTAALIQRRDLHQRHLESVFWVVLVFSLALTGLSVAVSGWWAEMNGEPDLAPVIRAMSIVIPIQGLTTVQVAIFQRSMDFRSLAIRNFAAVLMSAIVGISLALAGFGVWALVFQQVTNSVVALVLLWTLSTWRPRLRFSISATWELLGFSTGNFVAKLGVFIGNRSDELLIGLFFGAFAVGIYRSAMGLVSMLVDLGTRAIGQVSFPQFSRSQDDFAALRRDLMFFVWLSGILMAPALSVLAGTSDSLMAILGDRWRDAADVLQILCLVGLAQSLTNFIAPVLQGLGRTRALVVVVWCTAMISNVTFVIVGLMARGEPQPLQPLWMATARALLFIGLYLPISLLLLRSVCGFTLGAFFTATRSSVLAGAVAYGLVRGLGASGLLATWPDWSALIAKGALGIAVAFAILGLSDREFQRRAFALLRQRGVA